MIGIMIVAVCIYGILVVVGLFTDCVSKIPGASTDPKAQKFFDLFDINRFFPVDKSPPGGYNDSMLRPGNRVDYSDETSNWHFWKNENEY